MDNMNKELYNKLSKLQWLLQRHHMVNHAENGPFADTTRGQGRVLAMLKIQPEISTKDLSYLLGIKVASLNELLSKLEKKGYIVRKPSENDKRVMINHLTEKGREEKQATNDYSGIFDCLDESEQETFSDYLDRVITALETQVGSEYDEDEINEWMNSARSRMGDDMFEHIMDMRGGFGPQGFGDRHPQHHGPEHHDPRHDGQGPIDPRNMDPRFVGRGPFGGFGDSSDVPPHEFESDDSNEPDETK